MPQQQPQQQQIPTQLPAVVEKPQEVETAELISFD
jgi:hypothetical protein